MSFRGFLREMRASFLFGRASKLARREQYQEAREVLQEVLRLVSAATSIAAVSAPHLSSRLAALKLRSQIAAKLNDVPLATASIHEALALWGEVMPFMKPGPTVETVTAWESWARRYLAWAERGETP